MFQVARGCAFLCGFGSPLIQPTRTVKNVTARLPRFRTKLFGKHGEFRTTGNGGIPPTTLSTAMSSSGSSMAPKASTYLTPGSFSSATADDCARSDRAPTMLPAIPALCPCLATWCRIYGRAFAPSPPSTAAATSPRLPAQPWRKAAIGVRSSLIKLACGQPWNSRHSHQHSWHLSSRHRPGGSFRGAGAIGSLSRREDRLGAFAV